MLVIPGLLDEIENLRSEPKLIRIRIVLGIFQDLRICEEQGWVKR